MSAKSFWYIAAESKDLRASAPLAAQVCDEWLALYRDAAGAATAVLDRCLHRNARLSRGRVVDGQLACPYHGWRYGERGVVTAIPSEGLGFAPRAGRCLTSFPVVERDGYVYVRVNPSPPEWARGQMPFALPFFGRPGYRHIRLKHVFRAKVPNCVENFIDIPHTTFVHPNIFRYERPPQRLTADVELERGNVHVRYREESSNFGFFSKFLNPRGREIFHEDHYYFPNVTHVEYRFGERRHFNIISQSVPVSADETHVYTDLTYDYGWWNLFAQPIVRWVARKIIGQDVRIMGEQSAVTRKYGELFASTKADLQHVWIEQIYATLLAGGDPRELEARREAVDFWI